MPYLFFIFLFVISPFVFGQNDTIIQIDEVKLYTGFRDHFPATASKQLPDSILQYEVQSLNSLFQNKANLYLRESGNGMIAGLPLRGNPVAHTAVFWNGVPVNSVLNGQTDFNTFVPGLYDRISIRKGGGGVLLGSGAIGGAVNLQNNLSFRPASTMQLYQGLASFRTYKFGIGAKHASTRFYYGSGMHFQYSGNNYPYYDSGQSNHNAAYALSNYQMQMAYKIHTHQKIYYKSAYNTADRNVSGTLYMPSYARLKTDNLFHLIGWERRGISDIHELKFAYITEDFNYIFDKQNPDIFSDNKASVFHLYYNNRLLLSENWKLQSGLHGQKTTAKGTDISRISTKNMALYSRLDYRYNQIFLQSLSFRKTWQQSYKIPVIFSFEAYQKWRSSLQTHFRFSTNFRLPTINDLYWNPGGNPHLKPEHNWDMEASVFLKQHFNKNHISSSFAIYYSKSKDLIQWRPQTLFWSPVNVAQTRAYGLELDARISMPFSDASKLILHPQYAYTFSENQILKTILPYTPQHQLSLDAAAYFRRYHAGFDAHYYAMVFTDARNREKLPGYFIGNLNIGKSLIHNKLSIQFYVRNLFNTKYQIMQYRPMPMRNFAIAVKYVVL